MLLVSERKKDTRKNCLYNVFFFVFNVHVCFILSCIAYVVMLPFHLFSFATFIIIQRIAARTITHVHTHTHTLFIAFPATAVCSGFPSLFFVLSKKQSNNTPFFPVSFYLPFFFFVYAQLCLETMHTRIQTIKKRYIYIYISWRLTREGHFSNVQSYICLLLHTKYVLFFFFCFFFFSLAFVSFIYLVFLFFFFVAFPPHF